jgi:hypothetical protein
MELINTLKRLIAGDAENPAPDERGTRVVEAAGVTVDDDDDSWRRLSGDTTRDLSPTSQNRMRDTAVYLWEANSLANRLIELPIAFMLAEGVRLSHEDDVLQLVLDAFWGDPINQMDVKLERKVRELAMFGEQCWPVFVNEHTGHVRLGYLDPALIATVVHDPDNPEQPIGIVSTKDKRGRARRYRVIINGPEDVFTQTTQDIRESFTDGECFFIQVNVLSAGRRGRSDLLSSADWLDAYDEFLFNELERAKDTRAHVWDVTLTGADRPTIDARAKELRSPGPRSMRVHNENETWQAVTPELNGNDSEAVARLFRNHALGAGTLPEHWYGGGGDVNRAVGAEMGEPTFKVMSMRQRLWKYTLQMVGAYVLRKYLGARADEPNWDDPQLSCEAVFPELTARDTTKWASAMQQVVASVLLAIEGGLMTEATGVALIQTVAGRLGVEFDAVEELRAAKKDKAKRIADDFYHEPMNPQDPAPPNASRQTGQADDATA